MGLERFNWKFHPQIFFPESALELLQFICFIKLLSFQVFFGRTEEIRRCSVQESIPHHDIIHTHDPGRRHDEIIASALTLALQRQLDQRKETVKKDGNEKETSQVDCSLHLQQLRQIDKLREDKILSDEEFSELKSIIMETIINEFQNKKD